MHTGIVVIFVMDFRIIIVLFITFHYLRLINITLICCIFRFSNVPPPIDWTDESSESEEEEPMKKSRGKGSSVNGKKRRRDLPVKLRKLGGKDVIDLTDSPRRKSKVTGKNKCSDPPSKKLRVEDVFTGKSGSENDEIYSIGEQSDGDGEQCEVSYGEAEPEIVRSRSGNESNGEESVKSVNARGSDNGEFAESIQKGTVNPTENMNEGQESRKKITKSSCKPSKIETKNDTDPDDNSGRRKGEKRKGVSGKDGSNRDDNSGKRNKETRKGDEKHGNNECNTSKLNKVNKPKVSKPRRSLRDSSRNKYSTWNADIKELANARKLQESLFSDESVEESPSASIDLSSSIAVLDGMDVEQHLASMTPPSQRAGAVNFELIVTEIEKLRDATKDQYLTEVQGNRRIV